MHNLPSAEPVIQHRPRDECGVFAVFNHPNAAEITFYGLYALQHRGQESAGIVATGSSTDRKFRSHHGMGLVPQVFNDRALAKLEGTRAIGHVRYSTTGSSTLENAQPIVVDCSRGQIAIGHNGNLVNAHLLRDELESEGAIFKTTVDSEVILHLMAQPSPAQGDSALVQALCKVKGAFSLVLMSEREIVGVRDSFGFRPLCIGQVDDAWLLSSESCAFDIIPGAKFLRDVEPGEIVVIDENGLRSIKPFVQKDRLGFCIFEYVYFAGPTARSRARTSAPCAPTWAASWRGCTRSRPISSSRCPTPAITPRSVTARNRASPTIMPSCATTTSAAPSSILRRWPANSA